MISLTRRLAAGVLALSFLLTLSCRSKLDEAIIHKDDYKQAYIYAYPMIANYKAMYSFNIDKSSPTYKGPFNTIVSDSHLFTSKDTAVLTPDLDTPLSMLQADLRAEPIVFCVPPIEKTRYYSVQLIDMYTFNYGYVSSRTSGYLEGCFMVTGPKWHGVPPPGILKMFESDTDFSLIIFHTQLFGPNDIANVKKIQAGYTVQTLSAFTHQPPPPPPPAIEFPKFTDDAFGSDFPKFLNFLLQFCPQVGEEAAIRLQFATIGIGAGLPFDLASLSPEKRKVIDSAVKESFAAIQERKDQLGKTLNGWKIAAPYGSRDFYHGDNIRRAAAVMLGIYGSDPEEAVFLTSRSDGIGAPLNTAKRNYTITFSSDKFPPVNAFWSVTIYDAKTQLLVDNPINRYLINSEMLPGLKKNADGSVTIYVQKDDPSGDKKSNWLPAPDGAPYLVMRLYWPRKSPPPSILPIVPPPDATWGPPGVLLAH